VRFIVLFVSLFPMAFAQAKITTFSKIEEITQTQKITKLDDLVPELKGANALALRYSSRSLQGANFEYPRVLLLLSQNLLVALNGDPRERGYHELEVMQFLPRTAKFEFHRISFSADGVQAPVIERNPAICLTCHRPDARPNWETGYGKWPGIYSQHLFLPPDVAAADAEKFGSVRWNSPRYESLYPYYWGRGDDFDSTDLMGKVLTDLNNQRIARIVKEDKKINKFRYAIAYALWCATSGFLNSEAGVQKELQSMERILESVIPISYRKNAQSTYRQIIDSTFIRNGEYSTRNLKDLYSSVGLKLDSSTFGWGSTHTSTTRMRFIVEELAKGSMKDWSTALSGGDYDFNDGGNLVGSVDQGDYSYSKEEFGLLGVRKYLFSGISCDELARLSRKDFGESVFVKK
jgi:hypothetical protein